MQQSDVNSTVNAANLSANILLSISQTESGPFQGRETNGETGKEGPTKECAAKKGAFFIFHFHSVPLPVDRSTDTEKQ